jgi:hypothetical protein
VVVAELAAVVMRVVLRWSRTWWSPSSRRSTSKCCLGVGAWTGVSMLQWGRRSFLDG